MANEAVLAGKIAMAAKRAGFTECGIIRTGEMRGYAGAIQERISRFPHAAPMYGKLTAFADPESMIPWAKSVVICTSWHGKYRMPKHLEGLIGKSYCFDERLNRDSSEYMGAERFEAELDSLGVRWQAKRDFGITAMRWAAAKAGIGIVRRNNFFYTSRGSWNHLHAYVTDQDVELKAEPAQKKCPENCGLCMSACPTGALREPFQTDGTACVAFLLCMNGAAPGKKNYDKCGGWIYGCDICQNVCPFNKDVRSEEEDFPGLAELAEHISYEKIMEMDYGEMRGLLSEKFWYIKPDQMWKWKCNVLNALRNRYEEKYRPLIESALNDPHDEVRDMAKWVLHPDEANIREGM